MSANMFQFNCLLNVKENIKIQYYWPFVKGSTGTFKPPAQMASDMDSFAFKTERRCMNNFYTITMTS